MNRELFTLRQHEDIVDALQYVVALGITGAPVIDEQKALVGFVSWRDLVAAEGGPKVLDRMSVPAMTISADAEISAAAQRLCDENLHHLVCVEDGRPVGFVGSVDVLRGLTGRPVTHPAAFPHWDAKTGLRWSDEAQLTAAAMRDVPVGKPGLYVLVLPSVNAPNEVVWSEAVVDVGGQLRRLLEVPKEAPPHLAGFIERGELWFRYAEAPSVSALLDAVRAEPESADAMSS